MTSADLNPVPNTSTASTSAPRWFGVGHSVQVDARLAAGEAIAEAVGDRTPSLLIVLCSPDYDLPELTDVARAALPPGAKLAGGTTNGQLSRRLADPGFETDTGVVVLALGGDGLEVQIAAGHQVSTDRRAAGAAGAAVMSGLTLPHQVCLMFCDGLTREQHEVVRGGFSVLGALVPIIGGCTGDNLTYRQTHQFHGTRDEVTLLSDGLVSIGLASAAPIGVGIAHGWQKVGEPMLVTSSVGGRVFELDNQPALPVYLSRLGADASLLEDPAAFRDTAFQLPLGLSRRSSEDIRVVHAGDLADNSLHCLADVPQGALVWTMTSTPQSLIDAAREACTDALDSLDGHPAAGVLMFDCGARKVKLGRDGVAAEIAAIAETVQAPFGGFYTFGELARVRGSRGMHHLTVVSLALGS